MLFDGLACYMVENLTKRLLNEKLWRESRKTAEIKPNSSLAADLEEEDLLKLRRSNATLVKTLVVVTSLYTLRTILKDDIFGCLTK
jgi:hypothetical protein